VGLLSRDTVLSLASLSGSLSGSPGAPGGLSSALAAARSAGEGQRRPCDATRRRPRRIRRGCQALGPSLQCNSLVGATVGREIPKTHEISAISTLYRCGGGERGIRTLGTLSRTHAFQACALNRSATSPAPQPLTANARQGRGRSIPFQTPSANPNHASIFSAARNADCGISTLPNCRIRFLPSFCFSSSFRLREMSPP
jgi:hypothetical protein